MNSFIINERTTLPDLVRIKLSDLPVHYARQMDVISSHNSKGKSWQPAGVLIPLCFNEEILNSSGKQGGFVIQFIRRSATVAQGGDLSGPGGMLNPRMDFLLKLPLAWGMTPVLRGSSKAVLRHRGTDEFNAITLFLANALRESWEELRLNPFNVKFLGALPFQNLILFTRTIFPLVGLVEKQQSYRPNHEVDRVVEIPLSAFFDKASYATYCVNNHHRPQDREFETLCLPWRNPDGEEDILWGATLRIIMDFLRIVFNFTPPDTIAGRVITTTLPEGYMKGNGS